MCDFCDSTYTFSQKQHVQLAKKLNLEGVVAKAINQLFEDKKIEAKTKDALFAGHYEPLKQAVNDGITQARDFKIEYGTPNYEFLKQLQTNTAVFAAFKTHASMKDMAALLKDNEGKVRSRDDFKKEALKVDSNYRGSKLETEYDTGVRSARMAANWQKYQNTKRLYPNLKYLQTKAAIPDPKHLAYVGIIRPVDDAFWNAHYPPNRWRCQCGVEQTRDAATDIPDKLPPVPDDFAFNSGKTGQVFDLKNSEYIKSVPPKEQPALIKMAEKYVANDMAINTPYQTLYKAKSGGKVEVHPLTFDDNDFDRNVKAARAMANEGHNFKMLPELRDPILRKELLPKDVKELKNPDGVLNNGLIADIKTLTKGGANTITHAVDAARKQCNNVIIMVPEGVPLTKYQVIQHLKAKAKFKEMNGFGEVWVNYKGEWLYNPHKKISP